MASGTITFGASGALQGKIDWSSSSNGSSANSSNVTAILYARRTDGYSTWGQSWSGYVKIGSTQTNINFGSSVEVGSGWVEMARVSATVKHNDNGTGSVNIAGSVTGPTRNFFKRQDFKWKSNSNTRYNRTLFKYYFVYSKLRLSLNLSKVGNFKYMRQRTIFA